jgi:hypothetical protein
MVNKGTVRYLAALERFRAERPAILGLAVAEFALRLARDGDRGEPAEPFDVVAFVADGSRTVYTTVRP